MDSGFFDNRVLSKNNLDALGQKSQMHASKKA